MIAHGCYKTFYASLSSPDPTKPEPQRYKIDVLVKCGIERKVQEYPDLIGPFARTRASSLILGLIVLVTRIVVPLDAEYLVLITWYYS